MPSFADLDQLRTNLDTLRPLAPEQEARVLQKFRLEWNYNSNAIEGNSLTLGETRSLLLHGLTAAGKPMRDHLDIKGHNEAIHALEDFVRAERPLTEHFIREMHQVLLGEAYEVKAQTPAGQPTSKTIQPGRYKTGPNNVLTATGEIFYFATVEETPARMTDLVDWYRQEDTDPSLHPVALAAEFHYRFVRIHPFGDGNGRMSRLLMNLILLRHGYPMTVIKNADRNRYLAALAQADADEFEPFLQFIIENVEDSLRLMIRAARGESIEEASDLDKKLALLKKQIATREAFSAGTWSLLNQQRLYEETLGFWLSDLEGELARFDELFATSIRYIQAVDVEKKGFESDELGLHYNKPNAITLTSAAKVFVDSLRIIGDLVVSFEWDKFLKFTHSFDLGVSFRIKFLEYSYQITFGVYKREKNGYGFGPQKIFESTYLLHPNHNDVHILNHQLANKVYDFIAAKVAEADILPIEP